MSNRKGYVIAVTTPRVAHEAGTYEVTVLYGVKSGAYTRRVKCQIFTFFKPELYTWLSFKKL